MEFAEAVRRRRMVRNFTEEPVDPTLLHGILDLARRAPSAGYTQGFAFLVLEGADQVGRFWNATFPDAEREGFRWPGLFTAPVIVLPCSSKQAYLDRYAEPDKGWVDKGESRWPVPYWDVDCAFATMTLLLAAVDAGLGALFFGIFGGLLELRAAFGVPEEFTPIGAVALGHPAPDEPSPSLARGRRPFEDTIHRGRW
ncbi:MAG TPA: nitroreductase family protein [Acidimicrobiia bacterium]|jgi:nitroreductase